jgi:hypothetical protein
MGSALVALASHASASINPDNVDRPKISAGDRDFGNKDIFGILSGGIVNWDETDSGTRSTSPKFTPWVSGILYVNNLAWQSTRVEVDYHDFSHNEPHTWDSATFTPVDNKKTRVRHQRCRLRQRRPGPHHHQDRRLRERIVEDGGHGRRVPAARPHERLPADLTGSSGVTAPGRAGGADGDAPRLTA